MSNGSWPSRQRTGRVGGASLVTASLAIAVYLGPVTTVWAKDKSSPPAGSAVLQYVESVPTAGGGQVPGVTKSNEARGASHPKARGKAISPVWRRALRTITTSTTYGAPSTPTNTAPNAPTSESGTSVERSLGAALGTVGSGGNARLVGLLLVVLVITLTAVFVAAARRRVV